MGVAKRYVGLDFPRCYNSSMTDSSNNDHFGVKVVVIGGGTGSFTLLSGLKKYTHSITALVNMVDDGGSTGVLRDELGVLPAGDVRQCLVAQYFAESSRFVQLPVRRGQYERSRVWQFVYGGT